MQKPQQAHRALPLWQPDGVVDLLRILWRLRVRFAVRGSYRLMRCCQMLRAFQLSTCTYKPATRSIRGRSVRVWQARDLLVVLREPSDVRVPLPIAAAAPADIPGRCAVSTQLAAALCSGFAEADGEDFGQRALTALRAWMDLRFPELDPRFRHVADRDGAAMLEH